MELIRKRSGDNFLKVFEGTPEALVYVWEITQVQVKVILIFLLLIIKY